MSELPSNSGNATEPTKSPDTQDILDSFKEGEKPLEDEKPVKTAKREREADTPDDDDDEKPAGDDDEIELKGEESPDDDLDAEKLDLDSEIKIETPPRKAEITKEFPKFFEKFPWMEKMMFRDKQYTELFGSFDDAKEVKASADTLSAFEQDLLKGDTTTVLAQIQKASPETFDKITDNYLPNLYKVSPDAYYHVVGNITRQMIKSMMEDGNRLGNADLTEAAKLVNRWMFSSEEIKAPTNKSTEKPKSTELDKERQDFINERFETAKNELQTKIDNVLKATISDYIDPKGEMSPYVKRNAVRDALQALHNSIGEDGSFVRNNNKLWENAFRDKFSQSSLNQIRSVYLGKSKSLLSQVIRKARTEALKDAPPRNRNTDSDDSEDQNSRRPARKANVQSGPPRQRSGNDNGKNQMRKGESVQEFLSRD